MSSRHLTSRRLLRLLVVLLNLRLTSAGPLQPLNGTECAAKGPASYILVFTGHWSPQAFPKQYPLFRPPAQWSKLIGEKWCKGKINWFIESPEIAFGKIASSVRSKHGVQSHWFSSLYQRDKMRWKHTEAGLTLPHKTFFWLLCGV